MLHYSFWLNVVSIVLSVPQDNTVATLLHAVGNLHAEPTGTSKPSFAHVFNRVCGLCVCAVSAPAGVDETRGARLGGCGLRLLLSSARHHTGDHLAAAGASQGEWVSRCRKTRVSY